jgi:uncharacterized membrane protein YhaH (DUF805 family)
MLVAGRRTALPPNRLSAHSQQEDFMGFGTAVTTVFGKYVGFQGRARRSEFWWWILFTFLLGIVAGILDAFIDPPIAGQIHLGYIATIFQLAVLLPSIAVAVRRLHDTDRSGWWLFLALIPLIGAIILIIWYCQKGTAGPNKFGADPTA